MYLPTSTNTIAGNHAGEATLLSLRGVLSRWLLAFVIVVAGVVAAEAETRTLRLYYTHTKESATITFKKNGKYIRSGLKKVNRILRDFRRNEPTKMDPKLLDLVWEVYQKSGSRKPIHVISGYRSPRTNSMLRRRGRKVAKNSQHMRGKALDFFLPDVPVAKLRALGLKAHGGGVGYYRGSFVHLDTGKVRHWPRMSSRQLAKVFPRGRTIHVPSNGKRLRGYKVASANIRAGLTYDGRRRGKSSSRGSLFAGLANRVSGGRDESAVPNQSSKKPRKVAPPKPVAVVKKTVVKKPAVKKPSGPDPFSLEIAAAQKAAEKQKREQELVVAAAEIVQPEVPENAELAWPTKIGVPKRRPVEIVPQVAEITPEQPVVVAIAEPVIQQPVADNVLRPSADIPQVDPVPARFSDTEVEDIGDLKSRIKTALNRQRQKSVVEKALEAQVGLNNGKAVTVPTARNVADAKPVLKAALDPVVSKLRPATPTWRANTQLDTGTKIPVPKIAPQQVIAAVAGELDLGDLDGDKVKAWALASSTRIGPLAKLIAPHYDECSRRAAPASVYSAGFANGRAPLRSDRFSGRALTRVAFAYFNTVN